MTSFEIINRIDQLSKTNPLVRTCWHRMVSENLKYEQFLALAVVLLAEQNQKLLEIATKLQTLQPPPPIVIQTDNPEIFQAFANKAGVNCGES